MTKLKKNNNPIFHSPTGLSACHRFSKIWVLSSCLKPPVAGPHLSKADACLAIIWCPKASELIKGKVLVYLSGFVSVVIIVCLSSHLSARGTQLFIGEDRRGKKRKSESLASQGTMNVPAPQLPSPSSISALFGGGGTYSLTLWERSKEICFSLQLLINMTYSLFCFRGDLGSLWRHFQRNEIKTLNWNSTCFELVSYL